ncbi:hypothetical protein LDENG_00047940 [Lucifuga dentata]|nr:hypothetical protein LDENG_00047940 [Lucifuga dentata]
MKKRLIQVMGFLISTLGWVFILCTIAMDYWRITQLGGQGGSFIIRVAWYWSNLWKDCFTDSTAVTNCRDFPVLWTVTPYIQGVRGLLLCGLSCGLFAAVFCFLGMECTYIGGADKTKDKLLLVGAAFHFVGSVSDVSAYCLYINRIARTTFAESIGPGVLRYDLGPPIFQGLVGCFFILLGAVLYAVTVCRLICPESTLVYTYGTQTYMDPRSRGRSLYTGYYRPPKQYGSYLGSGQSSSSKISKLSQTTPEKMWPQFGFRSLCLCLVCVSGWILVCSTMPTEIWTWSEVDSIVLTTSNYFSNLWKDCVSDSTGVSDCKGITSMFALNWDIHMCRALIIISIILAFFGSILVLVGMKCTKIGGTEIINAKVTFAGGMNYLIAGLCSMTAFSYYGNKIRAEFQDPNYRAQKFEIGVGVFIGWGGSTLLVAGGLIYSIFAGKEGFESSSETKRLPLYRFPDPYLALPAKKTLLSSARTESSESRKSRSSGRSRVSSVSEMSRSTKTSTTNAYV